MLKYLQTIFPRSFAEHHLIEFSKYKVPVTYSRCKPSKVYNDLEVSVIRSTSYQPT